MAKRVPLRGCPLSILEQRSIKRRRLGNRRLDLIMGLSKANGEELLLRALAAHCERLADPKIAALDRELKRNVDDLWKHLLITCRPDDPPEWHRFLEGVFRLRMVLIGADGMEGKSSRYKARWVMIRRSLR